MVKYTIKEMDNKTRKGTHIRIWEKGYPSRYYKLKHDLGIEKYIKYYTERYINKRKIQFKEIVIDPRQKETKKAIKKVEQKIKERPTIKRIIHPGITRTKLNNLWGITDQSLRNAKKDLLRPLVADDNLLRILTESENFKKLTKNLTTRITYYDEENTELSHSEVIGEDPEQVISKIRTKIRPYMDIGIASKTLSQMGEQYKLKTINKDGNIKRATVEIIMRKG